MSNSKGELAVPSRTGLNPISQAPLVPFGVFQVDRVYTSIAVTDEATGLRLFQAINNEQDSAAKWINKTLDVVDVTLFPAVRQDGETGEVSQWTGMLLHLQNGATVRFGSNIAAESILNFMALVARPPYDPVRQFLLEQRPTDDGRSFYKLVYIEPKPKGGK